MNEEIPQVNIDFTAIDWQKWDKAGATGRVKMASTQGKRVRLLELPAGFDEEHLCERGHIGYVLEGEFTIRFADENIACAPGMGFVIPDGVPHSSKGKDTSLTVVYVVDDDPVTGES